MGAITHNGEVLQSLPANASQINFDNDGTDLSATQTENAIKEVNTKVNTNTDDITQLKSGLTNVTTVTVTTNNQLITLSTVYAKKLGKILLVSGYFYVAGQDILKDTLLFTVGQSILSDVFTSLVSSDGDVARLKMATNGEIYSEYTFKADRYYSFEIVAITN